MPGRSGLRLPRAVGVGLAVLVVAVLSVAAAAGQPAPRGGMVNWGSDVATAAVTGRGREPATVTRVMLETRGGAVVVQWSLGYQAQVSNRRGVGDQYPLVELQAMAALERDGLELARWILGEDQARGAKDARVAVRAAGTASGLFVDRTPGSGRKTYQLKVWNERMTRCGTATITVGTRTMICEER